MQLFEIKVSHTSRLDTLTFKNIFLSVLALLSKVTQLRKKKKTLKEYIRAGLMEWLKW
jgi:hypothetical protein